MYSEMEWIKSEDADPVAGGVPPVQVIHLPPQKRADTKSVDAGKMNSRDWQEFVEKLAAQFHSQDIVGQALRLPNEGSATPNAFGASLEKSPLAQINTGTLSPLQEDDAHYYAVAVMEKGKDGLKLATIAWLKELLKSWLAKAEAQVPVTMVAGSANYSLPLIAGSSGGCIDDTWAATAGPPDARDSHTAVWTGSEMIVWGGDNCYAGCFLNTGGRYNPGNEAGHPPARPTRPMLEGITRQCGPAAK